ncbi:NUDIX hydrolase [Tsukamurella strandjordii]|uniref:NUDIX domain-containing protein n=1 Tax=Tsukamurella strandjordii TaxID=147577 RepID=A0AA90SLC8_9ACTN|nr:NUDIX domain-containing protein [Tsukamurella strandjordii]MDP0398063.1 NUDIX domain-containing protein [Tsukamurella strandjordii]
MADDEVVALYDDAGRPDGSATRARVRAENLRHATTAILVFDPAGRIYVHRRTPVKDVYPGLRDFCAGGVLLAGESPDDGAAREAFEELGVHGVPLLRVGTADYIDAVTRFVCFQYVCTYDGPIVWQPEEVAGGEWMTRAELLAAVADDPGDFVPDSVQTAMHLVTDGASPGAGLGQDSSDES